MTNASKFTLEREIKDIKLYLERAEQDEHLYDVSFLEHKRMRLKDLEREYKELTEQ